MKSFLQFIAWFLLFGAISIVFKHQQQHTKQLAVLQQRLDATQQSTAAIIDAAAENLIVDSMHIRWQARYWTPRDAYLLEKSATVLGIKARNLQKARQTIDSLATLKFDAVDSVFVDIRPQQSTQVSFSKNR